MKRHQPVIQGFLLEKCEPMGFSIQAPISRNVIMGSWWRFSFVSLYTWCTQDFAQTIVKMVKFFHNGAWGSPIDADTRWKCAVRWPQCCSYIWKRHFKNMPHTINSVSKHIWYFYNPAANFLLSHFFIVLVFYEKTLRLKYNLQQRAAQKLWSASWRLQSGDQNRKPEEDFQPRQSGCSW